MKIRPPNLRRLARTLQRSLTVLCLLMRLHCYICILLFVRWRLGAKTGKHRSEKEIKAWRVTADVSRNIREEKRRSVEETIHGVGRIGT